MKSLMFIHYRLLKIAAVLSFLHEYKKEHKNITQDKMGLESYFFLHCQSFHIYNENNYRNQPLFSHPNVLMIASSSSQSHKYIGSECFKIFYNKRF